eukprot:TRINITY_DN47198_c0_g1_i1.p1 TRINITY_DN47198_c0_g1~~TRINITY_DN47198_c0_g1_i1.p1  ORF type:complete len:347 (+),score=135.50 TRINITY_DN47198_c0_g1_i1:80-1042(+)
MAARLQVLRSHLGDAPAAAAGCAAKKAPKVFSDPSYDGRPLTAASLMSVAGKVALVTGGSKGIGRMIAAALVHNGAKVYICARKRELCEEAATDLNRQAAAAGSGGSAVALPGDLSNVQGCVAVAEALQRAESKLHLLWNNAGATWGAPYEKYPDEAWARVMDLNVRGVFNLTQKLTPLLEAGATAEDPARVVLVASVDGIRATQTNGPNAAFAYTVSKGAVVHMTGALSRALSRKRITVNCIAPGVFPSNMTTFYMKSETGRSMAAKNNPMGRVGNTFDMGALALFLSGKGSGWINGAVIPIDGGAHIHDPPATPWEKQ